ncbi:hypothetical protein ACFPRL_32075 [Pseudoclavibacter helvolus]
MTTGSATSSKGRQTSLSLAHQACPWEFLLRRQLVLLTARPWS